MNRRPKSAGADTDRAIGRLVREGAIASVDREAGKAVVDFGDGSLSPPIDWNMQVGDTTIWMPPTVGQQVSVVSPEGDDERAYIDASFPSSQFAPLFMGATVAIRFKDGALISYDPESHALDFQLPGTATITAAGGLTIGADVAVQGDLTSTGTISADVDVVGAGKSLKTHRHTNVQAGSAVSGPPQ
ncbi:MAG: phage baseplate assembly protein V [Brevundimonas sp.]|uniref:phage baseplate assembly protein V n=1 Tax=Brevundimonas sp. TaxID=1871086 RepID=UPI00272045FA|nr:phage baseplate assembly protein V [Brevundimonas sp.]MDO9607215.1 phage baseplate assembly protein V [Brevundimonas sp.]